MRLAFLIVAAALLLLLYLPFAGNGFLYDDYAVVLEPSPLHGIEGLARLLLRPFYPGLTYYRPLSLASYQLQRTVFGDRPATFHAANAVLAAIVFLVAYAFLRLPRLRILPLPAWLASALFAAHPLASSCVFPISGRDTLLASIFVLASVYAFCRGGKGWSIAGLVSFGLGLASKESAVVVPGLVLLADLCGVSDRPPRREATWWIRRYLPLGVMLLGYLLARQALFAGIEHPPGSPANFLLSFVYALQVAVLPFVDLVYEPPPGAWLSPWRIVVALLVLLALARAWPRRTTGSRPGWFWAGWFLVSLLPTANLIVQETRFAEHYVFLALLALLAAGATWASASWERAGSRRATVGVGGILLVAAVGIVVHRGPLWEEEAFYRRWILHDPQRVTAHYNFGTVLEKKGKTDQALEQYRSALALDPDHDGAHNNLGRLLVARGDADAALGHFERAVELNPRNHQAWNNLGAALALRGDLDAAMARFRRAIELDPRYENARANLGHALLRRGDPAAAIEQFRIALRTDPGYADAHYGLGAAFLAQGRDDLALPELREALRLDPDLGAARLLLERAAGGPDQ